MSILNNQSLFFVNIVYGSWVVNVYPNDRHYFVFYVSEIIQIQHTHIPERARTPFFIFNKLMNIFLGPIPSLQFKRLLLYRKTTKESTLLAFYIDKIFEDFKTYQEQFIFLCDYFFLYMVWSQLKLVLFKVKIRITHIFTLEKKHKIDIRVRLNPDKIQKILTQLLSQDSIAIKAILGTIQSTKCQVLGFIELIRYLICLTGKVEQRWSE